MNNISWILYPILAAFCWATSNHLDKYLLDKYCKNREIGGLIIFSSLIGIPIIFLIYLFNPSVINVSVNTAIITILGGILYILGIIPYLYALEKDETSVVAPQVLMLAVVTGILGFIFLDERITAIQILGISIVILGSVILSSDITSLNNIKIKTSIFLLMFLASTLVGIHVFIFKYFAIDISFWATVFWLHVGFALIGTIFVLFFKTYRRQFSTLIHTNPLKIIMINIIGEIITIIGNLASYYGVLLAPLAISETLAEGTQPFFILIIGILITVFFPKIANENLSFRSLVQKMISVAIMVIGIILLLG